MNISVDEFVERMGDKKLTIYSDSECGMSVGLCDAEIGGYDDSSILFIGKLCSLELRTKYLDIEAHGDGSYTFYCDDNEIYVTEELSAA